jgi:mannosyltransferase
METHRKIVAAVLLIVILGFTLRVYHLGRESLWLDEAAGVRTALLSPAEIINEVSVKYHPPLYFLLLHGWIGIGGESEFSVRLLSALIGTFSIFLIYRVGRLIFNQVSGVLAALLLCLSQFHIFYSQETRMYSLVLLLTLASMYYFLKLIRGEDSLSDKVCYILFSVLLLYTHNVAIFIIAAQNLFIFSSVFFPRNRSGIDLKRWLLLQGVLVIFYGPWLIVLFKQLYQVSHSRWSVPRPGMPTLLHVFVCYGATRRLALIFALLLLSAAIDFHRPARPRFRRSDGGEIYLLLVWLMVPVLLPFIISQIFTPIYIHKVTIGALPALYLLAGRGIDRIRIRVLRIAVVTLIVILALLNLKHYYEQSFRDQWRDVANYIDSFAADGDLVICDPPSTFPDIFAYYWRRTGLADKEIATKNVEITPANIGKILASLKDISRVWVLLSYQGLADEALVKEKFGGSYYLALEKKYYNRANVPFHGYEVGLKVYLFVRRLKPGIVGDDDIPLFARYPAGEKNHNLIKNSGFEGEGEGWNIAREWLTGDTVHTGRSAIHIRKSMVPRSNFYFLIQRPIKLKPGCDYIFGAFIKTKELRDDIRVEIRKINRDGPDSYYSTRKISGDNDWTLLMEVFKGEPGDSEEFKIGFRAARLNNFQEGEFWVDDAFIIPYNHFPRF